jgi:GxxExxY protein
MDINQLTGEVIRLCLKIHSTIGPGCFERVYEEILYYELAKNGMAVNRQVEMPISYETLFIPRAYKLDLLVENKLIVEIKSVETILPVHFRQMNTQLKLMKLKHGMIINFSSLPS